MHFKISFFVFGFQQKNNNFSLETILKRRFFVVIDPILNIRKYICPRIITRKLHFLCNIDFANRAC
jgi:hypothetical protein